MKTEPFLDKDNAKRHRQLQAEGQDNRWWEEQAKMLEGCPIGSPLPDKMRVGELPYMEMKEVRVEAQCDKT